MAPFYPWRPLCPLPRLGAAARRLVSCASSPPAPDSAADPLRILFCGSDAFSCASLRALHAEQTRNRPLIASIDVMVLPPKRTGRGLKRWRNVPCMALAEELGLRLHQRDTFRNWDLPIGTNLIIAVSFGLFVPPRILKAAKYGGLNVHPSFLPDLRGPAPIHHAILRGDSHLGISLQTLHHQRFDHGTVLAQTPPPGLAIPPDATLDEVTHKAAAEGAQLLVDALRRRLQVPPYNHESGSSATTAANRPIVGTDHLMHAPKLTRSDAEVDWATWTTVDHFSRRIRVFSSLWTRLLDAAHQPKRIVLHDAAAVATEQLPSLSDSRSITIAQHHGDATEERRVLVNDADGSCFIPLADGQPWLRLARVTVEGKPAQSAASALRPFFKTGPSSPPPA